MTSRKAIAFIVLLAACGEATPPRELRLELELVADGLDRPVFATAPEGDPRLFVVERVGHYLYADYCAGWLRSFRWTAGGPTDQPQWAGLSLPGVVSFGRDAAGELYMVGGTRVFRLVRG